MNFFQNKLRHTSVPADIRLTAGSELLSRFQDEWGNIHKNSQLSSAGAKELSRRLEKSILEWKQTEDHFNKLYIQLQMLPALVEEVESVAAALGKLESTIEEVSCSIDLFEKVCNEHEQCKKRQAALQDVNDFRISKRQELERIKESLAKSHAQQLSSIRVKQASSASEREATLKKALSSDAV